MEYKVIGGSFRRDGPDWASTWRARSVGKPAARRMTQADGGGLPRAVALAHGLNRTFGT